MENHNVSTSNILLETIDDDILITVTLSTPSRDIGINNKDSAPATPCASQVSLETELTALKRFVVEQFYLIKKFIQEIKDPNHDALMIFLIITIITFLVLKALVVIKTKIMISLTLIIMLMITTTRIILSILIKPKIL